MGLDLDLNDDRWAFRFSGTPHEDQILRDAISDMVSRLESDNDISLGDSVPEKVFIEVFLSNEDITNEQLIGSGSLTEQNIEDYLNQPAEPGELTNLEAEELSREKYPNYDTYPGHIFAVELFHIISGLDRDFISQKLPGLGFTGSTGSDYSIYADFSQPLLLGTTIHDVTSYMDESELRYYHGVNDEGVNSTFIVKDQTDFGFVVRDVVDLTDEHFDF